MSSDDTDELTDSEVRPVGWNWLTDRLWSGMSAITCVLVATTVLSLFARGHWLADIFANLRVQQVIAVVTVGSITVCFRRWRWVAMQAVLIAIHLPWLATVVQAKPRADPRDPDLKVMVANVWTANRHHQLIVDQILAGAPDVLAVLELGTALSQRLQQDLTGQYEHRLVIPNDEGNFGIALYSQYPLAGTRSFHLNDTRIESIAATVTKDGQRYHVITSHPLPPVGSSKFNSRNEHLRQLASRVAEYREQNPGIPVVVMGDLNVTPWSPIFGDFETTAGLRRAVHGNRWTPTWYAKQNFAFGLILDHGMISDELECVSHEVSEFFGSDHRAVMISLTRRSEH